MPPGWPGFRPAGAGQRLPEAVQAKMQALFRADFSDVRVHVGQEASSIGAVAFTFGSNVYFAHGHYNPGSPQGQRLLAHELTHVLQQKAGRVRNPFGSGVAVVQDPALEAEAERMGLRASAAPAVQQAVQPRMPDPRLPRPPVAPPPVLQPRLAPPPVPQPRVTAPRPGNPIQPFVAPPFRVSVIQGSSTNEDEEKVKDKNEVVREKRKREKTPPPRLLLGKDPELKEKKKIKKEKIKKTWPDSLDLLGETYVKVGNENDEIFYQLPERVKNNDQYISIHNPGSSRDAWTEKYHAKAVGGGKSQVSISFNKGIAGETKEYAKRESQLPKLRKRASDLGEAFWEAIQ